MERVVKYVNKKFKNTGNSKEVLNQKEELIAGMHDKIYDAMARGKSEDEAFNDAVASLEGLEELTEELNGNRRTVYVNRLKFHHSLMSFGLIVLVILAFGAYTLMEYQPVFQAQMLRVQAGLDSVYFNLQPMYATFFGLAIALFATAIWPVVWGIRRISKPAKTQRVALNFHKSLIIALVGWVAVSLLLFAVNIAYPPHYDPEILFLLNASNGPWVFGPFDIGTNIIFWFIYPMIGIFTWPISILLYNLLFKSKRYLAK